MNYGRNLQLDKNVFINANCSFLYLSGITIEDDVMFATAVVTSSESHPISEKESQKMTPAHIHIKKCRVGAHATILSGVTIGENFVVAKSAVVTQMFPITQ